MNQQNTAYIIENRKIREVEVIKITRDFVTVRYQTILPGNIDDSRPVYSMGGFRLRKNRVFASKEDAEKQLENK